MNHQFKNLNSSNGSTRLVGMSAADWPLTIVMCGDIACFCFCVCVCITVCIIIDTKTNESRNLKALLAVEAECSEAWPEGF